MAHTNHPGRSQGKKPRISPGVTLAIWRLRQTWRLLLLTGIGIVAAMMFTCIVPFYSDMTMSAGLRNVLASSTQNSDVSIQSTSELLDAATITRTTQDFHAIMQKELGSALAASQLWIQSQTFPLPGFPCPAGSNPAQVTCDFIQLISAPTAQATPHLTLAQGRLPQPRGNGIEIALTTESAARLHVHPGSILTTTITFFYQPPSYLHVPARRVALKILFYVVGEFLPPAASDPFWHGNTYLSSSAQGQSAPWFAYTGLASSDGYLSYLSRLAAQPALHGLKFDEPVTLLWYYSFDTSRIAIYNLDDIENGLYNVQTDIGNSKAFNHPPFLELTRANVPTDMLEQFKSQMTVVQFPITVLIVLVLSLVLFFVSMMAHLLVESQANAIAILRSRGASRRQLFASFVTQSVILELVALLLGPLLAIGIVYLIAPVLIPGTDQSIRDIIAHEPAQVVVRLSVYALITAVVTFAALVIAVGRSVSLDILSMRREAARPVRSALWQRLNLDIVAALLALLGYIFSIIVSRLNVLDAQLRFTVLSPLALAEVIFLFIAGILLFLRFFPLLLRVGTKLTIRRSGAVPMLAMTQMSRTPHQALRLTLLLTLAITFTIFSATFIATQSQRAADVAAYQAGADFSGIPATTSNNPQDMPALTMAYKRIPGVLSASLGYRTTLSDVVGNNIDMLAVDADTFAQSASWSAQDSAQPLASLTTNLAEQRITALGTAVIPVYVDAALWSSLDLSSDPHFALDVGNDNSNTLDFVALGEVQHIPPIQDTATPPGTTGNATIGGMLVDYQTFAGIYINAQFEQARQNNPSLTITQFEKTGTLVPMNYAWLRTANDPASLASVRKALNGQGKCCTQLSDLLDRRAIIATLQGDPLYLTLIGLLAIGAAVTLLLALLGNLTASWLNTRGRSIQFVVLRALGATSQQIASIFTWEQCITYITSIVLGAITGLLLTKVLLPYLIYTGSTGGMVNAITSQQYYLAQSVPPLQIIFPGTLGIIFAALVVICIVALAMMMLAVARPAMNRTLRLNED